MKTYRAPWGKALVVVSALLLLMSIASVVVWPILARDDQGPMWIVVQWALPAIVLACLPFVVRGYVITEDAILITRLFWSTRLDRADLSSAEPIPNAMSKCLRVCGNGGVFSFTGWYWSKQLGFYRAFVTDLNRTVVLRFGKKTVVLSPEKPDEFVAALGL
jgi:hypothetical protein